MLIFVKFQTKLSFHGVIYIIVAALSPIIFFCFFHYFVLILILLFLLFGLPQAGAFFSFWSGQSMWCLFLWDTKELNDNQSESKTNDQWSTSMLLVSFFFFVNLWTKEFLPCAHYFRYSNADFLCNLDEQYGTWTIHEWNDKYTLMFFVVYVLLSLVWFFFSFYFLIVTDKFNGYLHCVLNLHFIIMPHKSHPINSTHARTP